MVNAAIVQSACGRHRRAEQLLRDGLEVARRTLPANHIGTLFGLHTLACVLSERGRDQEAVEILVDVTARQTVMASHRDDYHPDRLGALVALAQCYCRLGDMDRSLEATDEALRGFATIAGPDHPLAAAMSAAREQLQAVREAGEEAEGQGGRASISFPSILYRVEKT